MCQDFLAHPVYHFSMSAAGALLYDYQEVSSILQAQSCPTSLSIPYVTTPDLPIEEYWELWTHAYESPTHKWWFQKYGDTFWGVAGGLAKKLFFKIYSDSSIFFTLQRIWTRYYTTRYYMNKGEFRISVEACKALLISLLRLTFPQTRPFIKTLMSNVGWLKCFCADKLCVTLFEDLNLRPNLAREARTLPLCYTVQQQVVSIYIDRSEYYGHRMSRPIFMSSVITYFYIGRSTPEVYTFAIPFLLQKGECGFYWFKRLYK